MTLGKPLKVLEGPGGLFDGPGRTLKDPVGPGRLLKVLESPGRLLEGP